MTIRRAIVWLLFLPLILFLGTVQIVAQTVKYLFELIDDAFDCAGDQVVKIVEFLSGGDDNG